MTKRHEHIAQLFQRKDDEWKEVKDEEGYPVYVHGLTRGKIQWLNTACKADWKWVSCDD